MRVRPFAGLAATPWKNGGGTTREIASASDNCGLLWRLSLAEIARDGPFSAFPGLARIFTPVGQAPVLLDLPGASHLVGRLEPFAFDGDLAVGARLPAGPARALNVIHRATACAASVTILRGPSRQRIGASGDTTFAVHGISGVLTLDGTPLGRGDTALDAGGVLDLPDGAEAALVCLETRPSG